MNRRTNTAIAAAAWLASAGALAASGSGQPGYPAKPVRVIVPSQAGGGADIVARVIGQKLTEAWGQQVVIDNRIGAVGPEIAARAVPDGYTFMFTTSALTVREALFAK